MLSKEVAALRYTIEESTMIDAPIDAVWAVLCDLPRWPDWDPYVVSLQPLDVAPGDAAATDALAVGARWVERVRRGPFRPLFRLTVTERRDGESFAWAASYLFVRAEHRWTLHERDGGTHLVGAETFSGPAPIIVIARALFRLFRVRHMARRSLRALASHTPRRAAN